MNIFILTAGQCGSRVVTQAMVDLGYEAPGHDPENLDSRELGRLGNRFISDYDMTAFVKQHVGKSDNCVYKALPLLRVAGSLEGQLIGVYRHPGAWAKAHVKRVEARPNKKQFKTPGWWIDFHRYLLLRAKKHRMPLLDFSMDFEEDMLKYFGVTGGYDASKINETNDDVPYEPMMEIYEE